MRVSRTAVTTTFRVASSRFIAVIGTREGALMILVSILSLFLIAACVFVPIFGIAFYMLKSARRAFGIASVFALGSTFGFVIGWALAAALGFRSEEHTSELQSRRDLVCRLLLEKKKNSSL